MGADIAYEPVGLYEGAYIESGHWFIRSVLSVLQGLRQKSFSLKKTVLKNKQTGKRLNL